MSKIILRDLNFLEVLSPENDRVVGGITPSVKTSIDTATVTLTDTDLKIEGDLVNGFNIVGLAVGQGAGAAAAAASIGGEVTTIAIATVGSNIS